MSNKMVPFFLLCETPLHVGIGSDVGIVDMPIQRERHTGWPKIEASGLKGSIRESFEKNTKNANVLRDINVVFGYDDNGLSEEVKEYFEGAKDYSGSLGFTDGRILLFPVKSMKGIFAWVTCPAVLDRFFSDLNIAGIKIPKSKYSENTVGLNPSCLIEKPNKEPKVILEEFTMSVEKNEETGKIAEWLSKNILPKDNIYDYLKGKLEKDIIILSDDMFTEFVSFSTEVVTRTKIDNKTGTVTGTALFTEEYLPTETIMYSFAILSPIFSTRKGSFEGENQIEQIESFFRKGLSSVMQIGGNSNLGKGIVSTKIYQGAK